MRKLLLLTAALMVFAGASLARRTVDNPASTEQDAAGTMLAVARDAVESPKEMTVLYDMKFNVEDMNLEVVVPGNGKMKDVFIEFYKTFVITCRLAMKDGESDFRVMPTEGKREVTVEGKTYNIGWLINMMMRRMSKNYLYKNHEEKLVLQRVVEASRSYMISEPFGVEQFVYDDSEGTKEILGHTCRKAVSPNGKTTVWLTTDLEVNDEPVLCGLEGLALEMTMNEYNMVATMTAKEISYTADVEIVRPKGKLITREEFEEVAQSKMQAMRSRSNGRKNSEKE